MTQVDFYLLSTSEEHAQDHFICKLVEKIVRQRHTIHIHCKDRQETHRLDELLWTFNDISFIPHNILGEGPSTPPPVQLGFDGTPIHQDVLINLSTTIPIFHKHFNRILEIVPAHEESLTIAREHHQFYKAQNFVIKTHKINSPA